MGDQVQEIRREANEGDDDLDSVWEPEQLRNEMNGEDDLKKGAVDTSGVTEGQEDGVPKGKDHHHSIFERQSMHVAKYPCTYFWVSFLITLGLGVIGMIAGDFSVSANNAGWQSRGTLISERQTQLFLIRTYEVALHEDKDGSLWKELIDNVQPGWEDDDEDDEDRRLLGESPVGEGLNDLYTLGRRFQDAMQFGPLRAKEQAKVSGSNEADVRLRSLPRLTSNQIRVLDTLNLTEGTLLEGCDVSWYTSTALFQDTHLWPLWKTKSQSTSFFDATLLKELCEEEQATQTMLEKDGLCLTCGNSGKCLQPYSPVFYARLTVNNGMSMTCQDLADAWKAGGFEEAHKTSLKACVNDLLSYYDLDEDGTTMPESCPFGFFPSIMDEYYVTRDRVEYSSTIFATKNGVESELYDLADSYPRGKKYISGAYDTQDEDFVGLELDDQLLIDMSLAIGSAFVTFTAMILHTRSPFLAVVGLAQIVLSFPLSFFFYTFVARLEFFPFLNFIGIFVIFALGAGDVFVAVDKWKNERLKHPFASVEEVAAVALPDAAMAMLLTSLTTAVAFFGTAVCPVAPILCFAVFCGLLVIFDYMLCVVLVFPALCIYDKADHKNRRSGRCDCRCDCRCVVVCTRCFNREGESQNEASEMRREEVGADEQSGALAGQNSGKLSITDAENDNSLIHRILLGYYKYLSLLRWPLLCICAGTLVWCTVKSAQIELPTSSDVRLYDASDNQYEQNYVWRQNLLFDVLQKKGGSTAYVVWGLTPADTGNLNNPEEWTQLVLDSSFEPSTTESQRYLVGFCDRFFDQDFADTIIDGFLCPINVFDQWLKEQSESDSPSSVFTEYCNGAESLPMPEEDFDACLYNWGQELGEYTILAREGKITTIYFPFNSRVRFDSPFSNLADEWDMIESWMNKDQRENAPPGVNKAYFTSDDFWWYDTNKSMLTTAFTSAAIAMAAAAGVILFSSKSVILTLFATITVGYILTSVTAMLVAMGWTLGFIESILFAILIGVSCDFVIHFTHAYSHLKGHTSKQERTRFALLSMGPSVLATALTTFMAALVMLFTVITFFEKFAVVLFLTVLLSLGGSFVVLLTMMLCLGPSDPTYVVDHVLAKCLAWCGRKYEIQGDQEEPHREVEEDGQSQPDRQPDNLGFTEKTRQSPLPEEPEIAVKPAP